MRSVRDEDLAHGQTTLAAFQLSHERPPRPRFAASLKRVMSSFSMCGVMCRLGQLVFLQCVESLFATYVLPIPVSCGI